MEFSCKFAIRVFEFDLRLRTTVHDLGSIVKNTIKAYYFMFNLHTKHTDLHSSFSKNTTKGFADSNK